MEPRVREPEPLPDEPNLDLIHARRAAVDAILVAEDLETQARRARRRATSLQRNYERLLLEHGGQMKLPLGREYE